MADTAEKKVEPAPIQGMGRQFSVNTFGWVIAREPNGGMLKTQSVEALLLLSILSELQAMNGYLDSIQTWGVGQINDR